MLQRAGMVDKLNEDYASTGDQVGWFVQAEVAFQRRKRGRFQGVVYAGKSNGERRVLWFESAVRPMPQQSGVAPIRGNAPSPRDSSKPPGTAAL